MAKSQKQSGYLVKIEAFVPAELTDADALHRVQKALQSAKESLGDVNAAATITPTRR